MILIPELLYGLNEGCTWAESNGPDDKLMVVGVRATLVFSKRALAESRPAIVALLAELPNEFRSTALGGGGGWTFLNMYVDRNGRHWGEHPDMDLLVCLGLAVGALRCSLPRELWSVLPGGMPYLEITEVE